MVKVWGFSGNEYGPRSIFEVKYFFEGKFDNYPIYEFYREELFEFWKVIWWSEIPEPPFNKLHYKTSQQEKIEDEKNE